VAIAGLLALAVLLVVVPKVTGGMSLTVLTGSMEPGIAPGDMVVTKGITADNVDTLRKGDIITFLPFPDDPTLVTHRIVNVVALADGPGFVTRGDANNANDPWGPMTDTQIRGQVLYSVPKVGYLHEWVGESAPVIVAVAAGGLIVYAVVAFATSFRSARPTAPVELRR